MSDRLNTLFKTANHKLMSLFVTAGYPTVESTVDLVLGLEKAGADIIELGMPFSDPLADGPTIQYSSEVAIKNGVNIPKIFDIVAQIRKTSEIPIILMGYINPVFQYGIEAFFKKAAEVGVDGFILPDVILEEAEPFEKEAAKYGLGLTHLVAPNTSVERMKEIDKRSKGFVYCVSVTGVTGAREGNEVQNSVHSFINTVKENVTENPIMIGFGIKSYDDAISISKEVNGFIVGSALINTIKQNFPKENWMEPTLNFVKNLKYG